MNATPPGLARRFAAFMYDGALLFGVLVAAGLVYAVLMRSTDVIRGPGGVALFVIVPGAYFVRFWTRTGQTLALKTWNLRVVDTSGQPLTAGRALLRYVLAWLWFLPALVSYWAVGVHSGSALVASLVAGMLAYLLIARLNPQRQFLHDTIAGTRIVTQLPQR